MMPNKREFKTRISDENWIKDHWRPMMAWSYGLVCLWDFMFASIFFAWYSQHTGTPYIAWIPLTTQGGGLYHLAMGAIIGVTSYGRTQEKVSNNSISKNFQPLPPIADSAPTPADPEQ